MISTAMPKVKGPFELLIYVDGFFGECSGVTLPEHKGNQFAPKNRPKRPKRKRWYSDHPFSGANCWFQGVQMVFFKP